MWLSHLILMQQHNRRRRLGRLMSSILFAGVLAGCEATAKDDTDKEKPKSPPVETVTLEQCTLIKVQAEMIKCFEKLNTQNEAEIAALDAQESSLDRENTDKREELAEINTDIDVLSKELEDIRRETREVETRIEERLLEPER